MKPWAENSLVCGDFAKGRNRSNITNHFYVQLNAPKEMTKFSFEVGDLIVGFYLEPFLSQPYIEIGNKPPYTRIPFFEPDLSNINALVAKLKTYLIFS